MISSNVNETKSVTSNIIAYQNVHCLFCNKNLVKFAVALCQHIFWYTNSEPLCFMRRKKTTESASLTQLNLFGVLNHFRFIA